MNISTTNNLLMENNTLLILASLFLAAFVSYKAYPIIIKISRIKHLMDKPCHRSSHTVETPNLGGIGIFLGVIAVLTFFGSILNYNNLLCLIGALITLFFTGLKDDLVSISSISKLSGQIIASLCVILITDLRINSFHGLFGVYEISYLASVCFSLFVFVVVINAFNLIDGVDGLAGSIGLTSSLIFGAYFFMNENHSMLFVSLALAGALISFLFFNFSKDQKIFMGDTGSMVVGFLMAYQALSFLKLNSSMDSRVLVSNAPVIILAVFCFPLMDTLRVFIIRVYNKRSPFSADKNHIHHSLISLGFKHWQVTLIATLFSIFIVILSLLNNTLDINISFVLSFTTCLLFFFMIDFYQILKIDK